MNFSGLKPSNIYSKLQRIAPYPMSGCYDPLSGGTWGISEYGITATFVLHRKKLEIQVP
ncbi:MAG TPA: hypothetical protein VFG10_04060 [Saprospiraceae bacterium]|nr:hypothetical protein [Saprospiraceae bacterium]